MITPPVQISPHRHHGHRVHVGIPTLFSRSGLPRRHLEVISLDHLLLSPSLGLPRLGLHCAADHILHSLGGSSAHHCHACTSAGPPGCLLPSPPAWVTCWDCPSGATFPAAPAHRGAWDHTLHLPHSCHTPLPGILHFIGWECTTTSLGGLHALQFRRRRCLRI